HKERDFKFGLRHTLEFGPKFETDLGAYLEYAKVERRFQEFNYAGGATRYRTSLDEGEGWGPFLDATGRVFPWGEQNRCWSLWARGGFGLLYTEHKFDQYVTADTGNPFIEQGFRPEETNAITTKIEADMGIEYGRLMRSD